MNLSPRSFEGVALSLMRIVSGLLFAQHGFQKVLGLLGRSAVPVGTLAWVGGVLELVGGLAILMGLYTRPVAFVLCGEMAVAYFTAHAVRGFWPAVNGGELAVLYCFVFLFLSAAGPGPLSLDRMLRRAKL